MNVSLTPELEKWVESRVQSGLYASSSEVVRAALRKLYHEEEGEACKLEELRAEIQKGLDSYERGGAIPLTPEFVEGIKARGLAKQR